MRASKLSGMGSCLTVLGLLLVSCAPAAAPPSGSAGTATPKQPDSPVTKPSAAPIAPSLTAKPAVAQPQYGGILRSLLKFDIPSFDIHQESSSAATLNPLAPAYNGLLQYDPLNRDRIIGDLAEKWDVSSDGRVYTFYLNKGVKWHDGTPLSSEDVRFSIERMRTPPQGTRSPRQSAYKVVDKVEAPDKDTVKITLNYPSASFVPTAVAPTWFAIMPKHVIQAKGDIKREVIGTGPFKFKSFTGETIFEVVRNPDYFVKGRPYLDGISRYLVKEEATRFAAFRTKRIDITLPDGLTPAFTETTQREMPDATVFVYEAKNWITLYMNMTKPPWNDIRVRRAASLAIDRQKAIEIIEQGHGVVGAQQGARTAHALPESELLKMPGYRQPKDEDRAEAKRLLAEAGYPDGFRTTVLCRAGRAYEDTGVFVVDQLKTVGIRADIDPKESTIFNDVLLKRQHAIVVFKDSQVTPDPDELLVRYYASDSPINFSGFSDSKLDELLDRQAKEMDVEKRKQIVLEAQRRLLELVPSVVLFWGNYRGAHWPQVKDFKVGISTNDNLRYEVVWLAK